MYRALAVLIFSLFFAAHAPAFADTDEADKARIQLLENQVISLKEEVRRLRLMTSEMQTRLNQINIVLHDLQNPQGATQSQEETDCMHRLSEMKKRRDQLLALGLKEGHPDVHNVTKRIEALEKECAIEGH